MIDSYKTENWTDENSIPAGGVVSGTGLCISWQNGPLGKGAERREPNGAFVETVLSAARDRIVFYQTAADGRFECDENREAIEHITAALERLNSRTQRRVARGVEGTHEAD